jgi:hypothetical protein
MPEITPNEPNHVNSMGVDVDALAQSFAESWVEDRAGEVGDGEPTAEVEQEVVAPEAEGSGTESEQPEIEQAETGEVADEVETPAPVAITSLSVPLQDGSTADVTVDQVQGMLALAGWANSLSPDQREAFTAIERGQAIAIDRTEYQQFQAWQQLRNKQQPQPQLDDYLDDLDPTVAAQIKAERDELAQLRARVNQPSADDYRNANSELEQRLARYSEQRGITDEATLQRVSNTAIQSGIIQFLIQQGTKVGPTGQVLYQPDLRDVAQQALDYALTRDPELHSEVLTRQHAPTPAVDPSPATTAKVQRKKANAASVASAPSTAVPSPSGQPTHDILQTIPAMAETIARRLNGDGS